MCITIPLPWLTIDRLRSGRDIRLSTATMRALNSRRPQLTSTFCLFPRSFLCLLLLLFVIHAGRARSVPRDEDELVQPEGKLPPAENQPDVQLTSGKTDENSAPEQVQGKLLLASQDNGVHGEKVEPEEPGNIQENISQPEIEGNLELADDSNVKRVTDPSREDTPLLSEKLSIEKDGAKEIEAVETPIAVDVKIGVAVEGSEVLNQEDEEASVAKKRRRNDVALVGKSEIQGNEGIPAEQAEEAKSEGIRRFDVQVDAEGAAPSQGNVDATTVGDADAIKILIDVRQSEEQELKPIGDSDVQYVGEPKEEIPVYFRKSGAVGDDELNKGDEEIGSKSDSVIEKDASAKNRENRYLGDSQSKSRRKSSTVYLNAEEKKIPDGEQQSIVEGQIKKLISIRDDALDAQKVDKLDEAKVLSSKREVGMDEVAFTQQKNESERENKVKDITLIQSRQSVGSNGVFKKWRDQAIMLQEQIRNRTLLSRLKEQATELLPEIPKFTENQLLDMLEQIALSRKSLTDQHSIDSYTSTVKDLGLTDNQLRIVKCATQLLAARERQSFVANLADCIRGLSVFNCIKIFAWPIVVDNLPASISQNLGSLPIEINLFDLFQSNKQKSGRAQNIHQVRLITPETVVYSILQDALETYPKDETLVSYVNPNNETLKELLTANQVTILQMAEKLLPQTLRQEYSDSMFSCVRRFEYFSCVKYFAWPMIKQYFPALPSFPDYPSWYPIVDFISQYPILPFPSFSGDVGELPEVVDTDATRQWRPRLSAADRNHHIILYLENILKDQPRVSTVPSSLDPSTDSYIALIPQDQLLAFTMAEQLLPVSLRPEFAQKTVNCMKQYNYLTCIKYSTWPTIRQVIPTLPDISGLLPDFQIPGLSDIFGYLPQLPSFPDFGSYWPFGGASDQGTAKSPTYIVLKSRPEILRSIDELEAKILEVLLNVRNSIEKSQEISPFILMGNSITFSTFTKRQLDILQLTECLIPAAARPALITEVIVYLQRSDNFIDCVKYVMWPTIARYLPSLPEFPTLGSKGESISSESAQSLLKTKEPAISPGEKIQERINSDAEAIPSTPLQDKESGNKGQQNGPVISVTGTRFVPIFTEHPESVILNILRSVQLQAFNFNRAGIVPDTKNQQFIDFLNQQQLTIVNLVDSLLPQSIRPDFANKLIACLKENNFLICTRDVIWPTLTQYFPWLPAFPNFSTLGSPANPPSNDTSPQPARLNLTEPSSDSRLLSETDVKTGLHGDTTVTITDTRFFPIFNEVPESVILNILKAVQLSVPSQPGSPVPARRQEFSTSLTDQQINILQIAENLLPIPIRLNFIDRIRPCLREKNFLECTRDITWPIIAQSYPWLPSFPNFGSLQNLPRIRFQVFLAEKPPTSDLNVQPPQENLSQNSADDLSKEGEDRIEDILLNRVAKASPKLERSYLDSSALDLSHLTKRQEDIIRLVGREIPDSDRAAYLARIQDCTKDYTLSTCMQSITLPTRKEPARSSRKPDIEGLGELLSQMFAVTEPAQDSAEPMADSEGGTPIIPSNSQIPSGFPPIPAEVSRLPSFAGSSEQRASQVQLSSRSGSQGTPTSAFTPSVGDEGEVPGYAGQPPGILIDISKEKVQLPDNFQRQGNTPPAKPAVEASSRKRRSADLSNSYYETDEGFNGSSSSPQTFPNITESRYLELLVKIKQNARIASGTSSKRYFVDTLNSTIRDSLTADQYEILKLVEDLEQKASSRGIVQQVAQCIQSLSFIRCMGIFVWPLITNNLPSLIGLPSLPGLGILGRSLDMESKVQEYFGMSATDFESELLTRKETIETSILDWYKKLAEDKFQANVGFIKIKGYGNGELGFSFSGFREGRGAKLKDNKNLPSILTIISDIMEEVLEQKPEGEKPKRDKEKKERSIDVSRESDIQFLKDSEEYVDIKRSINDDEIITMFLDKIKSNDSKADGDKVTHFGLEDAYNAFGVLFGTRLHTRLAHKLQSVDRQLRSLEEASPSGTNKEVEIVPLESREGFDQLKVLPLKSEVTYDLEKESAAEQGEGQGQKRGKNFFKSFLDKHLHKFSKEPDAKRFEDIEDNKITDKQQVNDGKSGLIVKLPRLDDKITLKKLTGTLAHVGRSMKMKMMQMMPGVGLVLSFLIQMGLAHARTAASMAGIISNMAMGSALVGMIRDSFFGSSKHPQIKYVYDNDKVGPGISWPAYGPTAQHHE